MRSAALFLLAIALAGCSAPRAEYQRLWPGYERAIFERRDGREASEALDEVRCAAGWGDRVEVRYQRDDAVVEESSVLERGASVWRRRFVIVSLPAGRELVVRVPTRTSTGARLVVSVNGAPLDAERGALESVVTLARDEATVIELSDLVRE